MTGTAIAGYALISDCRSAALVGRDGSVDWLCPGRFDRPSVFARLLDRDAGHWSLRPSVYAEVTRRYLDGTMERIEATVRGWRTWSDLHQGYEGPWRDLVHHSGRVLQALTYQPTGAIVAAPTTSLPEAVGAGRNWDYRYTWVRDASLTLEALWVAACPDEAHRFFAWMAAAAAGRDASRLRTSLTAIPGVVAVTDSRALQRAVDSYLGLFYAFAGIMLVFGGAIAFVLIFSAMSVSVAERTIELATLRAAGVRLSRISLLVMSENVGLTLVGLVPGLPLGYACASWFMAPCRQGTRRISLQERASVAGP